MEIELSDDKYQKLTVVAQAAGYDDALSFVEALAEEATEDPRGRLSEEGQSGRHSAEGPGCAQEGR